MLTSNDIHSDLVKRKQKLISELQTRGLRLAKNRASDIEARKGGAGPSDHRAVTVMGTTVMIPVLTETARNSPYSIEEENAETTILLHQGERVGSIHFPPRPAFYDFETDDGIPYWKIAQLHARDVLATTIFQTCVRYTDPEKRCQFCAIGESLKGGRTIAHKTPDQLAEVAEAAQRLDGVRHMVMTTGTPSTLDRGAAVLVDSAYAVKERTGLPIQAQCEPPDTFAWFESLREAGVDTLGMHLEVIDPEVRARIMPSKSEVSIDYYMQAFRAAVDVFGRGQVTTYLLAGLGDTANSLLRTCEDLIAIGVYPFVVPFVPISGTRLEHDAPPSSAFMNTILKPLGAMLKDACLTSDTIKAGCGKCGACSSLSTFET